MDYKNHEEEPSTVTDSHTVPLGELLVHTSIPTNAVAVKLCSGEDSADEIDEIVNQKKDDILSTFKRRTFNRISFKGESGPLLNRHRQTKFSSRRIRKRVVFKNGDCNVVQENVAKRRRRYLQDIFTTLVDAQWRWTLLVFSMNFLLSWLGFALIWWLIAYSHGDLEPQNYNNENFTPCVMDIRSFMSCFLFSVETQHTIGYGAKHTTDECPEAIFTLCIQSMTGVILQAFMVGIVFAKLSRPKKRTQTLLFSRNAVICQRDGQPCLMFRVGDMRKSHIIEAHVRAQMIKRKVTKEGELLPFFQTELKVGGDGEEDKIFFIWPTTIVHKIDQYSPLYKISASDMLRERFEIVVILEGVIESTGMTTQARSSYLPSEILWGHRFQSIITFRKEIGEYEVDYALFNNTYEVDTPLCSAADLDRIREMHRAKSEYRETCSSSSLTMTSASSMRSSTGDLHMQMPTMPATSLKQIPMIITRSNDSSRRESINMHSNLSQSSSIQNEIAKEEHIKISRNQKDCDQALENASLKGNKNEEDRNRSKAKSNLRRSEEMRPQSKTIVKETEKSDSKISPCRSNADIRKSSVSSGDQKNVDVFKKTVFNINEEALIIDSNKSQNLSLTE